VADIFHEVDEEVRREQLKRLWDRYSIYLIALAVLIVVGIGAWRGYEYWVAKRAAAAGAAFEAAAALGEQGKYAEAEAAFAKVAADAPEGYRVLARMRAAGALAQIKAADAVKAYDELSADASLGATWQDLAAIRAGLLLVDTAALADMRRRLEPLAEPTRSFRHTARELLALSAWRNHDFAAVRRYLDMIATDADSPIGTRARADTLLVLSDQAATYQQVADELRAGIKSQRGSERVDVVSSEHVMTADDQLLKNYDLVITVGLAAARSVVARETTLPAIPPTLCLLIPRQAFERLTPRRGDGRPHRLSAVYIDQPLSRQLDLLRIALPGRMRIGVVLGPTSAELAKDLREGARERDVAVDIAEIAELLNVSVAAAQQLSQEIWNDVESE